MKVRFIRRARVMNCYLVRNVKDGPVRDSAAPHYYYLLHGESLCSSCMAIGTARQDGRVNSILVYYARKIRISDGR